MKKFIRRTELAASLGLKTGTLAKMDHEGRGPAGRFYASSTNVVYPAEEVEKWLRERRLSLAFTIPNSRDERGRVLSLAKAEGLERSAETTPAKGSS